MGTFNLRLEDNTHDKLKHIAKQESRSQNMQVEHIIKKYIEEFEKENGEIILYQE